MLTRTFIACLALVVAAAAVAQDKKRIDKTADVALYKIDGSLQT